MFHCHLILALPSLHSLTYNYAILPLSLLTPLLFLTCLWYSKILPFFGFSISVVTIIRYTIYLGSIWFVNMFLFTFCTSQKFTKCHIVFTLFPVKIETRHKKKSWYGKNKITTNRVRELTWPWLLGCTKKHI